MRLRQRVGTASPFAGHRTSIGDDSFYPRLDSARAIGIEPTVVERAGIGLDIDTPDDLEAFLSSPSDTRAYRLLAGGSGRDAG